MKESVVGIDIGGTFTKIGIIDREGNPSATGSVCTPSEDSDINGYLKLLFEKIEELKKQAPDCEIKGIGIGAPNGNYYNGSIEHAPNLAWKGIVPFVKLFQKYYNIPMVMTNDANAAGIGEMVYGGAKGMKNFIEITLGTGLGSGVVVNGEMVYGHDGFAGELGHTLVIENGRQCNCGKRGCLETYASATGIRRTVYELLAFSNEPSEFRTIAFQDLTGEKISELAKKGDPIAVEAFERTGKYLGMKLADAVAHTSPEAIFLFGGLALSGDLIFKPTKKYMEEFLLPIYRNKVKLLPSGLKDNHAAILGASALAWKELEK
jgi:glucokinase